MRIYDYSGGFPVKQPEDFHAFMRRLYDKSLIINRSNQRWKYSDQASELFNNVVPKIKKNYKSRIPDLSDLDILILRDQLIALLFATEGNLKDKVILDLGCGCKNAPDIVWNGIKNRYEPWLCRVLHELGAHSIGIDSRNLEGEVFEHHKVYLSKPDSLSFLKSKSVDVANAHYLFSSTENSPFGIDLEILVPQLKRIVKPKGAFVYIKD